MDRRERLPRRAMRHMQLSAFTLPCDPTAAALPGATSPLSGVPVPPGGPAPAGSFGDVLTAQTAVIATAAVVGAAAADTMGSPLTSAVGDPTPGGGATLPNSAPTTTLLPGGSGGLPRVADPATTAPVLPTAWRPWRSMRMDTGREPAPTGTSNVAVGDGAPAETPSATKPGPAVDVQSSQDALAAWLANATTTTGPSEPLGLSDIEVTITSLTVGGRAGELNPVGGDAAGIATPGISGGTAPGMDPAGGVPVAVAPATSRGTPYASRVSRSATIAKSGSAATTGNGPPASVAASGAANPVQGDLALLAMVAQPAPLAGATGQTETVAGVRSDASQPPASGRRGSPAGIATPLNGRIGMSAPPAPSTPDQGPVAPTPATIAPTPTTITPTPATITPTPATIAGTPATIAAPPGDDQPADLTGSETTTPASIPAQAEGAAPQVVPATTSAAPAISPWRNPPGADATAPARTAGQSDSRIAAAAPNSNGSAPVAALANAVVPDGLVVSADRAATGTAARFEASASSQENIAGLAAPAAAAVSGDGPEQQKQSVLSSHQGVENTSKALGINVAEKQDLMSAPASTPPSPSRFNEPMPLPAAPLALDALVVTPPPAASAADSGVASAAHRAVDAVMAIADQYSSAPQHTVSLQFSVSGVDLAVRVEMRPDGVHTVFRTDSSELRTALANEWQSVMTTQPQDRSPRLADPVFTSGHPGTATSADSGGAGGRDSSARQQQPQPAPERFSLGTPRATPSVVAPKAAPVRVTPASTALHLHTFA